MDPNSNGLGSIEDPQHIDSVQVQNVTIGHTATFNWDGSRFVFGHEPGGGTQAECEDQDPDRNRTFFMLRHRLGRQDRHLDHAECPE